jgi:hypothetical protein
VARALTCSQVVLSYLGNTPTLLFTCSLSLEFLFILLLALIISLNALPTHNQPDRVGTAHVGVIHVGRLYDHHLLLAFTVTYICRDTELLYYQSLRSDYVLEVFTLTSSPSSRILYSHTPDITAYPGQDVTSLCSTLDSAL